MVRAGLGYLAAADATQLPAATQAECLRELEQARRGPDRGPGLDPGRVHRRAGARRRRGLQHGVLARAPHRDHPRRRCRAQPRGPSGPRRIRAWSAALAVGTVLESVGRVICLWTGKLPPGYRDAADEQLLAASAGGLGLADLAGLFAEMYVRTRGDLPDQDPGREFADREVKLATTIGGAGVLHGDLTGRVRAAVAGGAGRAGGAGGERGRPHQGAAVPRRAGRGDAPADRGEPAAGAGRAAGEGLGAHLPGGPDAARCRLRPAGPVDGAGPGAVGRPPRARRRDRRVRRGLAGRRRRDKTKVLHSHGPPARAG